MNEINESLNSFESNLTFKSCIEHLKVQTTAYLKDLDKLTNPSEAEIKNLTDSYGTNGNLLKYFVQQQINTITQAGIDAAYAVSGLYQDGSGLSQAILNAQFIGESFSSQSVDYHNSIKKEHSLDFSDKAIDDLVAIDLGEYGFKPKSTVELAKRIALLHCIEEGATLSKRTIRKST